MRDHDDHYDSEDEPFVNDVEEAYELDEDAMESEDVKLSDEESDDDMGAVEGASVQETVELKDDSVQGFFAHKLPVYAVALHPSEPIVISGGGDDTVYFWHVETGETLYDSNESQRKFTESVNAVAFSHDGEFAAAGSLNGELIVWKASTGKTIASLEGPSDIMWMDWHPKGHVLLVGSEDGSAWMWSISEASSKCLQVFSSQGFPLTSGQFSPDGKLVITGSKDGSLRVWDPKTASILERYYLESRNQSDSDYRAIHSTTMTNDSQLVITGAEDSVIKLARAYSNKVIGALEGHTDSIECLAMSPVQHNILVSGSLDGKLNVWDVTLLKLRETMHHPEEGITKCQFLPQSHLVVTSSIDGVVRLWDSRTGKSEKEFHGHQDSVLDFDCNSHYIVTASDDGTSLVFSIHS